MYSLYHTNLIHVIPILIFLSVVERACVLGYFDILELFLENGCSANLPTSHGRLIHTVLTSLKSHRQLMENGTAVRVIRLLLSMDCDVNVKNYKGKSPLMLVSELADSELMKLLLHHCLDWQITTANKDNWHTPLHMVCMKGSVQCLSLLLPRLHLEDLHRVDMNNFSPLTCSLMVMRNNLVFHSEDSQTEKSLLKVQYSHLAVVEMIIQANNKFCTRSKKKDFPNLWTGLRIALETSHRYELMRSASTLCTNHTPEGSNQKFNSLYAELVRMFVQYCNIQFVFLKDLLAWKNKNPCKHELVREVEEFVKQRDLISTRPSSLLCQCRKVIRLHMASCDQLYMLDTLPLPRKLIDYVRFLEF